MVLQTNVSVCAKLLVALFLCKIKFYYEEKTRLRFQSTFSAFFFATKTVLFSRLRMLLRDDRVRRVNDYF